MTEIEREMDLTIAELEQENRLMRARNERLQIENEQLRDDNARFQVALERIVAVSQLAFRDSTSRGVGEVGAAQPRTHKDTASY
jgi:hypothetical protein